VGQPSPTPPQGGFSPPRSEATLAGAASPPGEARGAVRNCGPRVRSAHCPPRPGTAGPVPPTRRLRRREGDKPVGQPSPTPPQGGFSPPRSEATLGGAASPPGEARGAVRNCGPRVRSAHCPPRPGTAGPVPPTRRLRRREGDKPVGQPSPTPPQGGFSPPRSEATLGGAASPPGEARGAVRDGVVHEFAPLTAPLGPAQPGRSPQHDAYGVARGTNQWANHHQPHPRGDSLPPGAKRRWGEQPRRQARRGGPSGMEWSTSSLRDRPPRPSLRLVRSPQTPSLRSVEGGQTGSRALGPESSSSAGRRPCPSPSRSSRRPRRCRRPGRRASRLRRDPSTSWRHRPD
jgi:hypothetical protein